MMDATQYPVPDWLPSAVQQHESANDPNAVSDAGAVGLMQTMPDTLRDPGYGVTPAKDDSQQELQRVGRDYLQAMHNKYKGDTNLALMAYNWGPGNVDKVLAGNKSADEIPPETKAYPSKVYGAASQMVSASGKEVTDPDLLAQLNGGQTASSSGVEVTDPDLLAQLNGTSAAESAYSTDPARATYQAVMNTVAKPVNSVVSGVTNAATSLIPDAVKTGAANAAQGSANAIDSTGVGQWIGDRLLDTKNAVGDAAANVKDLEQYNPNLEKDLSALGENAQLAANIAPIQGARKAIGAATEGAADSLAASSAANTAARSAAKVLPYDDIATHSAISDSYGAAKEAVKPYYNLMKDIGAGETADAGDLKPALESMISDIQNTPFHEATSELSYLKQQAAKIGEDGAMPLNDMVKLKQNLNNNFNPKRFAQGADTPYSKVGSLVDDSLNEAGQRIPEFGEAKSLADKNWLNTVKSPFEDNTVLKKFWQPEDYYAKKSVDSGMLEDLPDPTKQRAASMVSGIKTPVQLNAVRRVLPQDLADSLSQAKIQHLTQGSGTSRISAAGKAIMGAPNLTLQGIRNTLTNIGQTIGGVPLKQAEKDLIAAAKSPSPTLSTKYAKPYQQLKSQVQQMRDSAGEMQPVNYPKYPTSNYSAVQPQKMLPAPDVIKPQLALPAPDTLVASPRGQFRPMTAQEQINAANPDNARGLTAADTQPIAARNDPRAPTNSADKAQYQAFKVAQSEWDKTQAALESQGLTYKQIINRIGARPTSFKGGGPVKMMAKGGAVSVDDVASTANSSPTDAQKAAGNYKKGHINLHGMPITIENPRGSSRAGKDASGKPWKVTMPDHYGYIKNTHGMDGEHVDAYIGPNPESRQAFIIDQVHADTGKSDEHKVMLGYDNAHHAVGQYQKAFSDGKGAQRIGAVSATDVDGLKKWLKTNATKKPAIKYAKGGTVTSGKNHAAQFLALASRQPLNIAALK